MRAVAIFFLFIVSLITASGASSESAPMVPDDFLRTQNAGWQRILATKVTADVNDMHPANFVSFLCAQTEAKIVFTLLNPAVEPQAITSRYKAVPLRVILYELTREAGLKVEWDLSAKGTPTGIRVHD